MAQKERSFGALAKYCYLSSIGSPIRTSRGPCKLEVAWVEKVDGAVLQHPSHSISMSHSLARYRINSKLLPWIKASQIWPHVTIPTCLPPLSMDVISASMVPHLCPFLIPGRCSHGSHPSGPHPQSLYVWTLFPWLQPSTKPTHSPNHIERPISFKKCLLTTPADTNLSLLWNIIDLAVLHP